MKNFGFKAFFHFSLSGKFTNKYELFLQGLKKNRAFYVFLENLSFYFFFFFFFFENLDRRKTLTKVN